MHGIEVIKNASHNRDAWLKYKGSTLGSSEIAVILGVNPYESRLVLWEKKIGRRPAFGGNKATVRGTKLEPAVLKALELKLNDQNPMYPVHVIQPDTMYVHPTHTWASASPDAYVVSTTGAVLGIAEAKAPLESSLRRWTHGTPIYYEYQLKWQMGVIGVQRGCVTRWFIDLGTEEEFADQWFQHDEAEFARMIEEGAAFMQCVRSETPPAVKPLYTWGRAKPKTDAQKVKRLEQRDIPLLKRYQDISAEMKEIRSALAPLEREQKQIREKLIELVGEGEAAQINGFRVEAKVITTPAREESSHVRLTVSEV